MQCFTQFIGMLLAVSFSNSALGFASQFHNSAECGLYAFLAANEASDCEIEPAKILRGDFISGYQGSTGLDLYRAAISNGLWADTYERIDIAFLRTSTLPVILNVKTDSNRDWNGHWITFLGEVDGKAQVFDNLYPNSVRNISFGELSMLMTGHGIMIGPKEPAFDFVQWTSGLFVCWPICLVFVLRFIARQSSSINIENMWPASYQFLFVICLAAGFVLVDSALRPESILRNSDVSSWVQSRHTGRQFATMPIRQLGTIHESSEIILVDARLLGFMPLVISKER